MVNFSKNLPGFPQQGHLRKQVVVLEVAGLDGGRAVCTGHKVCAWPVPEPLSEQHPHIAHKYETHVAVVASILGPFYPEPSFQLSQTKDTERNSRRSLAQTKLTWYVLKGHHEAPSLELSASADLKAQPAVMWNRDVLQNLPGDKQRLDISSWLGRKWVYKSQENALLWAGAPGGLQQRRGGEALPSLKNLRLTGMDGASCGDIAAQDNLCISF